VLAGYEVGDANWAPPPVEPFARTAQAEPGKLRIAATTLPPNARRSWTGLRGRRDGGGRAAAAPSDMRSEEVDPPWQVEGLSELSVRCSRSMSRLRSCHSASLAGHELTGETWSR